MRFLVKLMILCFIEMLLIIIVPNIDLLKWFTLGGFIFLSLLLYNLSYSFSGGISTPIFPEPSIVRMQIANLIDKSEDKSFSNKILKISEVIDSTNVLYLILLIVNIIGFLIVRN